MSNTSDSVTPFLRQLFSLEGRTAIVTGASRGIGHALALALAKAGADIILLQRDPSRLETKKQIEGVGRRCFVLECDLSNRAQVTTAIKQIIDAGHQPDILINNGGTTFRARPEDFPDEEFDRVMEVNLKSAFILARDFGKYLIDSGRTSTSGFHGKVISTASLLSYQGGISVPAYAASKHAILGLTRALANDWASKGINATAIAPGYIKTDMTVAIQNDPVRAPQILDRIPAGRWGETSDFEGVIVFLASQGSNYINGEAITVDGAWMSR